MISDINLNDKTIFIRRNKAHKERIIPISDDVNEMIKDYMRKASVFKMNSPYLFSSPRLWYYVKISDYINMRNLINCYWLDSCIHIHLVIWNHNVNVPLSYYRILLCIQISADMHDHSSLFYNGLAIPFWSVNEMIRYMHCPTVFLFLNSW